MDDESDTESCIDTTANTSSNPLQFIYQLRSLIYIGEDLGLLRDIAW